MKTEAFSLDIDRARLGLAREGESAAIAALALRHQTVLKKKKKKRPVLKKMKKKKKRPVLKKKKKTKKKNVN
jgi:hypothetical protein